MGLLALLPQGDLVRLDSLNLSTEPCAELRLGSLPEVGQRALRPVLVAPLRPARASPAGTGGTRSSCRAAQSSGARGARGQRRSRCARAGRPRRLLIHRVSHRAPLTALLPCPPADCPVDPPPRCLMPHQRPRPTPALFTSLSIPQSSHCVDRASPSTVRRSTWDPRARPAP